MADSRPSSISELRSIRGVSERLVGKSGEMIDMLRRFYPETVKTAERLAVSYPKHVGRRAHEMLELEQWLEDLNHCSFMPHAAKRVFEKLRDMGLDSRRNWDIQDLVEELNQKRFLYEDS